MRVDRPEVELLLDRKSRNWQDTYFHWTRPCRLSVGPAGAILHGGRTGQPTREGAKAVHTGPLPDPARSGPSADLRRVGIRHDEPRRGRAFVPRLRRPLRAWQHPGDEQPAVQRVEPDLPGRADDGGALGPPAPPLTDF